MIIWMTGLPCSGKTTLAKALASNRGFIMLDGDELREKVSFDLGFSKNDRFQSLQRNVGIASMLAKQGRDVVVSTISPILYHRMIARSYLTNEGFKELYIKCPVHICELRDTKGNYKKAKNNEISNFTGVSAIYEESENSDFIIDTQKDVVLDSVNKILEWVDRCRTSQ